MSDNPTHQHTLVVAIAGGLDGEYEYEIMSCKCGLVKTLITEAEYRHWWNRILDIPSGYRRYFRER